MNKLKRKWLALLLGLYAVPFIVHELGFRWNYTRSLQPGLYRLEDGTIQRNGYARVAPNPSNWYRWGVEHDYYREKIALLKKIIALEGDIVSYDAAQKSLTVNEIFIPLSEILSKDRGGRDMPFLSFPIRLKPGEAWLGSENERGYDSRYFA